MDRTSLAGKIDHTALKPETTQEAIHQLCREAREHGFYSVCVNPCRVSLAAKILAGTNVSVCSVVGFPFGATPTGIKAAEAAQALRDGASEIDMVLNIGWLLDHAYDAVLDDIMVVRTTIGQHVTLKVIIETAVLGDAEKREAARLVLDAGADFIKTSTGFHPTGGATLADVELLRALAGKTARVKASGGIRDTQTAIDMIAAGADRLGTSASVAIVTGLP